MIFKRDNMYTHNGVPSHLTIYLTNCIIVWHIEAIGLNARNA